MKNTQLHWKFNVFLCFLNNQVLFMLHWKLISFEEFSNQELYSVLKLRTDIFVVEQNCPYPELDGKDQVSKHFCGYNIENELVAYCRVLPPNVSYSEASIGRVLVAKSERENKHGRVMMELAVELTANLFPEHNIRIGAQTYLEKFYKGFGFLPASDPYMEDGIEHLEMIKNTSKK